MAMLSNSSIIYYSILLKQIYNIILNLIKHKEYTFMKKNSPRTYSPLEGESKSLISVGG